MDALAPVLITGNPFVLASRDPDREAGEAAFQVLAQAAKLNEGRVREVLRLVDEALTANLGGDPGCVDERLRAAAFGLAALLPPVAIRIRLPMEAMKSMSGRVNEAHAAQHGSGVTRG